MQSRPAEVDYLKKRIDEFLAAGSVASSICLVGRTHQVLELYAAYLREHGLDIYEIKRSAAEQREKPGVRIATMHRVKGLEFDHMLIVAVNKGLVPLDQALDNGEDAVARRNAEMAERSLLYVALTRSKKTASISCYGEISLFLR